MIRLLFSILFLLSLNIHAQSFLINPYWFAQVAAATSLSVNQKSIDLDGTAEYVNIADDNTLSFTNDSITIASWTKMDDATSFVIAEKEGEYLFWINASDKIEARFIDSDGDYVGRTYNTAITNDTSQWIHLAATFDGTTIDIYRNGIVIDDTDANNLTFTSMSNTANALTIGYDGSNYADGKLDQVVISGNPFTIAEVKELMAVRDQNYHSQTFVSWWDFDNDSLGTDNITDLIGSNHGTMQSGEYADLNTCVCWPYSYQLDTLADVYDNLTPMQWGFNDSIFGGFGIDLDGSAEYISVADNALLSFTNDTITISGWVEADDLTNFVIAEKEGEYLLWINASDKIEARFIDSGGDYIGRTYNTALTKEWEAQWMHVAATFDGTTVNIYWNGVDVDNTDANSGVYDGMSNTANALTIGYDGTNYANGRIGDVIIYDEVLTAERIDDIYNLHEPLDETNEALSANIVGYWRGYNSTNVSSGVLDQSGNGLNGTPTATDNADFQYDYPRAVLDSTGSFVFDGANEYIDCGPGDSLGIHNSDYSISLWFKTSSANADNQTMFSIYNDADNAGIKISGQSANIIYAHVSIGVDPGPFTYNFIQTTETYNDDKWHHIVATFDTTVGSTLYVDGVLYAIDGTDKDYIASFIQDINIGRQDDDGAEIFYRYYDGSLSHITALNKALSICEVEELYNDGSPIDVTQATFSGNVLSHWNIDQTDDPTGTVTDIVGNVDGTATNMEAGDLKTKEYPTN